MLYVYYLYKISHNVYKVMYNIHNITYNISNIMYNIYLPAAQANMTLYKYIMSCNIYYYLWLPVAHCFPK